MCVSAVPTRARRGLRSLPGAALRAATLVSLAVPATDARAADPVPQVRPATRSQAISVLSGGTVLPVPCLTPAIGSALDEPFSAPSRRSLRMLRMEAHVVGERALVVNQGTIYLCLVRLLQKRWISARWGTSENNRKAKFYAITKAGRAQLKAETRNWERISGVIGRVLQPENGLATVASAKAGS